MVKVKVKAQTLQVRVLVCCALFCSSLCRGERERNLLTDPGFENVTITGGLASWTVNSIAPFESIEVIRNNPRYVRSGNYSVKLVQTKTDEKGERKFGALYSQLSMPVEPFTRYTLSFWAKGNAMVRASVYTYQVIDGVESGEYASPPIISKDEMTGDPAWYVLQDGDEWKHCSYTFAIETKNTKAKRVRFVIQAHGTAYVDDCCYAKEADVKNEATQLSSPQTKTSPADETIRPNRLSVGYISTPPTIDGKIERGEYRTESTGLIDNTTQALYPLKNQFAFSYDENNLYFAFSVQLPFGYQLIPSGKFRDDPILVAGKDVFYLFLRPDNDVESKGFKGVYLAVSSNGTIYDAWEDIHWVEARCQRDASFNANWKVATRLTDNLWTLELSAPWKDLRLAPPMEEKTYLCSFGMNLASTRISWQPHPNWFDHYQAFGQLRFARGGLLADSPSFGAINRGALAPCVRLSNESGSAVPYDLTCLVSTPRMVAGQMGGYVFDVVIDPKQQQVIRDKSIFYWHPSGALKPGERKQEDGKSLLNTPSYYVLEVEAKTGSKSVFYQKVPFNYSPPVVASLTPVPSKDLIKTELFFYGARPEEKGKVHIAFRDAKGKVVLSQVVIVTEEEMRLPVSMASLVPGDYKVSFTLVGKDGKEVSTLIEKFRKWQTPVWLKSRKGLEALDPDWAPAPWTPLVVADDRVSLWGRIFVFQEGSLLAQLVSQETPLIASGITVKYLMGGKESSFSIARPRFAMQKRGRVDLVQTGASPHFLLSSKQRIEFDGMDRFDVTITPKNKLKVEMLWIEIPFENIKYWLTSSREGMHGSSWQAGLVPDKDYAQRGRYDWIWLGNDKVGCTFFAENYKGWLINSEKARIALTANGATRILKLLIVNEPSEVSAPVACTFGLHPTPVKPFFTGWRDNRAQGLVLSKPPTSLCIASPDYWNSAYSKPSPRNWQALEDMVAYVRKRNQKVHPYIGLLYLSPYDYIRRDFPFSTFDENTSFPPGTVYSSKKEATRLEEYFYFKEDWSLVPPNIGVSSNETREEVRVTPSGSWADYFVYGMFEMLSRTNVDGFFFDIDNPMMNLDKEKGLAYRTKDGCEEGTDELFALRDMYKRLYYLFDTMRELKRKPYFMGHGFPAAAPYMSFWDVAVNGEEIKPTKRFDMTRMFLQRRLDGNPMGIPVDSDAERSYDAFSYRTIYGAQFGLPNMYLPQYGYVPELYVEAHSRETLAWTFLHNTLLWAAYIPAGAVYDFWNKVEAPFGMGHTTFYPYWDNKVISEPECIKVSYWKKDGKEDYLVAVANWSDRETPARIVFPDSFNSYSDCLDMEKGEKVSAGKSFQVSIPPHDLRVFRFLKGG